jgi:hypothetical protein
VYKLGRMGIASGYNREIKVLERKYVVIPNAYAEEINAFSETNGLLYEKLVEETEKYYDKIPFKDEVEYTAFQEVTEQTKDQLDKIDGISTRKTPEEVDSEIKEANAKLKEEQKAEKIINKPKVLNKLDKNDIKETLNELRAEYVALSEKQPLPMWGKVQLTKEIAKLKN